MALHVHNTRTRTLEPFVPAHPRVVRIYTCGLTVYAPMHVGHARTYCFWDLFRRYLEYRGHHVLSVINYTDIDDRIMQRQGAGVGAADVAERFIATFRADCRALRIKDYAAYTRATDFVDDQVATIARLLERGHAYVVDGEVLYDVASFPHYGRLSGNTLQGQQAGASGRLTDEARRKRHPADFTLWKPSKPGEPAWETGHAHWPSGRPGWHIECSAMSTIMLGEHFDVHGGAVDNLFPHHENEVAQSEPLCGEPWVRYWMHPEHLDLRGEKMSKSVGNIIGIGELLGRHRYDEVRWFFATTHYRTRLAFAHDLIDSAAEGYRRITNAVRVLEARLAELPDEALHVPIAGHYASLRTGDDAVPRDRHHLVHGTFAAVSDRFVRRFIAAMDEDLGAPQATAALFEYVSELFAGGLERETDGPSLLSAYRCLTRHLHVLGIEMPNERLYPQLAAECMPAALTADDGGPVRAAIDGMVAARQAARAAKDFARADALRDLLQQAGIVIEDTPTGPRWSIAE